MVLTFLLHLTCWLFWFYMVKVSSANVSVASSYFQDNEKTPSKLRAQMHETRTVFRRHRLWFYVHALICLVLAGVMSQDKDLWWLLSDALVTMAIFLVLSSLAVDIAIRRWVPFEERFEA